MRDVKRELADDGKDGWKIYHLFVPSVKYDTIRVGKYNNAGDYRVEILRQNGWTHLLAGQTDAAGFIPMGEAIDRAVNVLFGP